MTALTDEAQADVIPADIAGDFPAGFSVSLAFRSSGRGPVLLFAV
jgi:hypothetical protein